MRTNPEMKSKIIKLRRAGMTIREIMKEIGLKSTSAVAHHLDKMKWEKVVTYIPLEK